MLPMYVLLVFTQHKVLTKAQGEKFRVQAYDSVVTIVEPEGSWFDWKLYVVSTSRMFSPN